MIEAQLQTQLTDSVLYYDAGTGVYLAWGEAEVEVISVLSQDGEREIGYFETSARTVEAADAAIRAAINDPTKAYGEAAELWTAGE